MSSDSHLKTTRILGSPFKSPLRVNNNTDISLFGNSPTPVRNTKSVDVVTEDSEEVADDKELICPLCDEGMINLYQLNQHIDDVHNGEAENQLPEVTITDASISKLINNDFINTDIKKWFLHKVLDDKAGHLPKKKSLNLDLLDSNKGFSLSDGRKSPTPTIRSETASPSKINRISRTHWKHPSSGVTCSFHGCDKVLNVKNGIVNCRKCGLLYCNQHSAYKIRLRNTKEEPAYDTTYNGVLSRCCETCYYDKSDLIAGTVVNHRDLTKQFKSQRQREIEDKELQRNKIIKRFINLSSQLVQEREQSWFTRSSQQNSEWIRTDNCTICFVQFNLLVRRHHCRLCGESVCDDAYGVRQNCSIMVPLNKLLDILPHLSYSQEVLETPITDNVKFRCCVNCKNLLLHDWKLSNKNLEDPTAVEIFQLYDTLLLMKGQVELLLSKFEQLISSGDDSAISKHRMKLIKGLKEFENLVLILKQRFFGGSAKLLVLPEYHLHQQILLNMYQGLIEFLQENFLKFKSLNDQLQVEEPPKAIEAPAEVQSALTKKQIRELREQLMVMNEQKFLVEQMIQDNIKMRKFEELDSLTENKNELHGIIAELERKLGEFGF